MRSSFLLLSMVAASALAGETRFVEVQGASAWDAVAHFLSRGAAEPGMMVALAAATVLLQFVRKYRTDRNSRARMFEPATLQGNVPATTEG